MYLKVYVAVLGGLERAGRLLPPVLQRTQVPSALGYRTPAKVFQVDVGVESNGRRCSLGERIETLAGAPGFSLNSALILSK